MPTLRLALTVCLLALPAAAPPVPPAITIDNHTRDVLRGIHLSPTTSDHWGPDRATENVRIRGKLKVALPGPGCRWDIRVILGNRPAEQIFRNRDICRNPVLVVDGTSGRFLRNREPARWN